METNLNSLSFSGSVVFGSAFGQNVLILNKWEDADELLERRAGLYTDRPVIPVLQLYVVLLLKYDIVI